MAQWIPWRYEKKARVFCPFERKETEYLLDCLSRRDMTWNIPINCWVKVKATWIILSYHDILGLWVWIVSSSNQELVSYTLVRVWFLLIWELVCNIDIFEFDRIPQFRFFPSSHSHNGGVILFSQTQWKKE